MKQIVLFLFIILSSCQTKLNPESIRLAEDSEKFAESGDWEKMLELNNKALEIDENNYIAYNNRAGAKKNLGFDSLEVISDLKKALELNPDYSIAKNNLIVSYFDYGNDQKTVQEGEKYLARSMDNPKASKKKSHIYHLVGQSYLKLKVWDLAKKNLSQAIELDPLNHEAYMERGIANQMLQLFDESFSDFNKAIELEPAFNQAFNYRGITWDKLNKHELAISDYSRAIEIDSTVSEYWFNRGLSHLDLNQINKACKDFQRALELGHPQAHEPINDKCK